MEGVTIVDHPLVQHKLTLIRDRTISTKSFRELLKEIGMLLCYEVTRDLPLTDVEVETPLAKMHSAKIAGKKLVFVPVLRAGVTFVEGMLDLVPTARVAHIGLYREPETFVAVEYFFKAPSDISERLAIVVSPVLATANTAVAAVDRLKERGARDIRLVCLLAAPEGVERFGGCTRMCRYGLPASTRGWMRMRLSCRALATPATALTGRADPRRVEGHQKKAGMAEKRKTILKNIRPTAAGKEPVSPWASTFRTASSRSMNQCCHRHSSRAEALRLSTIGIVRWLARRDVVPGDAAVIRPCQDGVAGEFAAVVADHHLRLPRSIISRSSSRATRMPESEVSATSARHSRGQSSTTVRMRKRRPQVS